MMTVRFINPGKSPVICPSCNGWGTNEVAIVATGHTDTVMYADSKCLFCGGRGVMLKSDKLEPIKKLDMNEDLSQMPVGIDVQVKITVLNTNTTVWAIAQKQKDGSILLINNDISPIEIISWREL